MPVAIKRIYSPFESTDGYRVLIDRLWPRGIKKEKANIDSWLKEIGPSTPLRKWFGHDPERWTSFRKKYQEELKDNETLSELRKIVKQHKKVTLLYGAKDEEHNHAVVLMELLGSKG